MSLLSNLIGLANNLTQNFGLQADVTYYAYLGADGAGARSYAAPVSRKAIVTKGNKLVSTFAGEMATSTTQIVFLDPTVVSQFDKIVLPDGTTQPILSLNGFVDASNGAVLTEINLGWPTVG